MIAAHEQRLNSIGITSQGNVVWNRDDTFFDRYKLGPRGTNWDHVWEEVILAM